MPVNWWRRLRYRSDIVAVMNKIGRFVNVYDDWKVGIILLKICFRNDEYFGLNVVPKVTN